MVALFVFCVYCYLFLPYADEWVDAEDELHVTDLALSPTVDNDGHVP